MRTCGVAVVAGGRGVLMLALLALLALSPFGCGEAEVYDEARGNADASESEARAKSEGGGREAPPFLTAEFDPRTVRGDGAENGPSATPAEEEEADAAHPDDGASREGDGAFREGNGAPGSTEEPSDGEDERSNADDDQWSAAVSDFPEPPPGLPGGGAATPEDAAKRFLTFLCTGDLELYVTSVHPSWLEGVERDELREIRDGMIRMGFPRGFELKPIREVSEPDGSDQFVLALFELQFRGGFTQNGRFFLENIGDENEPRWVRSEGPQRGD